MPTNPAHPLLPLSRVATIILLLTAASCAQPPTTASVAIPPIPSQQARVWFYREGDTAAENTTTPTSASTARSPMFRCKGAPSTAMSRPDAIRSRSTARA